MTIIIFLLALLLNFPKNWPKEKFSLKERSVGIKISSKQEIEDTIRC